MKAKCRERLRNLLCVLTGSTVIMAGASPTVVEAVKLDSSDYLLDAGLEEALHIESKEETEEKTETTIKETEKDTYCAGAALVLDTGLTFSREEMDRSEDSWADDASDHDAQDREETAEDGEASQDESTQEESTMVLANVNEYVNIRESAQKDAAKVGVLYKDCGGTLLEQKDGWSYISSGDVEGWVMDKYLYIGEEAEEAAEEVGMLSAVSTTQSLRVRKEPSQDAGVYGLLACNQSITFISDEGDWIAVDYNGQTGYVSADYVEVEYDMNVAESMEAIMNRERQAAEEKAKRNAQKEAVLTTASEVDILAALIQCEAGGESYEGQLAVGSVVMNRVRCGAYPNSITDVVYASGQFTPALSGRMNQLILTGNIKESCRAAAQEAINGNCNVGDALHFRRSGNRDGYVIGHHVFW